MAEGIINSSKFVTVGSRSRPWIQGYKQLVPVDALVPDAVGVTSLDVPKSDSPCDDGSPSGNTPKRSHRKRTQSSEESSGSRSYPQKNTRAGGHSSRESRSSVSSQRSLSSSRSRSCEDSSRSRSHQRKKMRSRAHSSSESRSSVSSHSSLSSSRSRSYENSRSRFRQRKKMRSGAQSRCESRSSASSYRSLSSSSSRSSQRSDRSRYSRSSSFRRRKRRKKSCSKRKNRIAKSDISSSYLADAAEGSDGDESDAVTIEKPESKLSHMLPMFLSKAVSDVPSNLVQYLPYYYKFPGEKLISETKNISNNGANESGKSTADVRCSLDLEHRKVPQYVEVEPNFLLDLIRIGQTSASLESQHSDMPHVPLPTPSCDIFSTDNVTPTVVTSGGRDSAYVATPAMTPSQAESFLKMNGVVPSLDTTNIYDARIRYAYATPPPSSTDVVVPSAGGMPSVVSPLFCYGTSDATLAPNETHAAIGSNVLVPPRKETRDIATQTPSALVIHVEDSTLSCSSEVKLLLDQYLKIMSSSQERRFSKEDSKTASDVALSDDKISIIPGSSDEDCEMAPSNDNRSMSPKNIPLSPVVEYRRSEDKAETLTRPALPDSRNDAENDANAVLSEFTDQLLSLLVSSSSDTFALPTSTKEKECGAVNMSFLHGAGQYQVEHSRKDGEPIEPILENHDVVTDVSLGNDLLPSHPVFQPQVVAPIMYSTTTKVPSVATSIADNCEISPGCAAGIHQVEIQRDIQLTHSAQSSSTSSELPQPNVQSAILPVTMPSVPVQTVATPTADDKALPLPLTCFMPDGVQLMPAIRPESAALSPDVNDELEVLKVVIRRPGPRKRLDSKLQKLASDKRSSVASSSSEKCKRSRRSSGSMSSRSSSLASSGCRPNEDRKRHSAKRRGRRKRESRSRSSPGGKSRDRHSSRSRKRRIMTRSVSSARGRNSSWSMESIERSWRWKKSRGRSRSESRQQRRRMRSWSRSVSDDTSSWSSISSYGRGRRRKENPMKKHTTLEEISAAPIMQNGSTHDNVCNQKVSKKQLAIQGSNLSATKPSGKQPENPPPLSTRPKNDRIAGNLDNRPIRNSHDMRQPTEYTTHREESQSHSHFIENVAESLIPMIPLPPPIPVPTENHTNLESGSRCLRLYSGRPDRFDLSTDDMRSIYRDNCASIKLLRCLDGVSAGIAFIRFKTIGDKVTALKKQPLLDILTDTSEKEFEQAVIGYQPGKFTKKIFEVSCLGILNVPNGTTVEDIRGAFDGFNLLGVALEVVSEQFQIGYVQISSFEEAERAVGFLRNGVFVKGESLRTVLMPIGQYLRAKLGIDTATLENELVLIKGLPGVARHDIVEDFSYVRVSVSRIYLSLKPT